MKFTFTPANLPVFAAKPSAFRRQTFRLNTYRFRRETFRPDLPTEPNIQQTSHD
jgi:hypothetical protein